MLFIEQLKYDYRDHLTPDILKDKDDIEILENLIDIIDLNYEDVDGNTLLMYAYYTNNINLVKFLLNKDININYVNKNETSVLLYSCSDVDVHLNIIELFLEKGADINHKDKSGHTCLLKACRKKNIELVKLLIEKGSDVNHNDIYGYSIISNSLAVGNNEISKLLIENGVDVNYANKRGDTALTYSCISPNVNVSVLNLLLDKGANINHKDKYGDTPLLLACAQKKDDFIRTLIERGADINCINKRGETIFTRTSHACCKDEILSLIEIIAGSNSPSLRDNMNIGLIRSLVNEAGINGRTCLMKACVDGNIALVKTLISVGADVNYVNSSGDTALTFACANGYEDIVKFLILNNMIISDRIDYDTMFILAYYKGHINIIKILISAGYNYLELSKYSEYDVIYVNSYIKLKGDDVQYFTTIEEDVYLNYRNNIFEIIKEYVKSSEYNRVKNRLYSPLASDLFAQIVCVSDNYSVVRIK